MYDYTSIPTEKEWNENHRMAQETHWL